MADLFEIKTNIKIPSRKLGIITKKEYYPTFTTQKFIEILKYYRYNLSIIYCL